MRVIIGRMLFQIWNSHMTKYFKIMDMDYDIAGAYLHYGISHNKFHLIYNEADNFSNGKGKLKDWYQWTIFYRKLLVQKILEFLK